MELTEYINYLLTKSQYKVFQNIHALLVPFDITPIQFDVLYCLWQSDNKTPKQIASELKLENSSISKLLDQMDKKGLIQRYVNIEDRRYINVALTEKGRSLKEPLTQAVSQANHDLLINIPESQQILLKQNLRLLAGL